MRMIRNRLVIKPSYNWRSFLLTLVVSGCSGFLSRWQHVSSYRSLGKLFIEEYDLFRKPVSTSLEPGRSCIESSTSKCATIGDDTWSASTAKSFPPRVADKIQQERFIHPQVIKMFKRAQVLLKKGDNQVAKKLLLRCLELNPKDSHSWLALARLEAKVGNIVQARAVFQEAVTKCPGNIHLLHAWGHLEQKHNNIEKARYCWGMALNIQPYNAYVCFALSNLEKRLRNFARADAILREVVTERPTAALCVSLAELERQQGNPEQARQTLLQGLQRCKDELSKILLSLSWLEEDAFNDSIKAMKYISDAMDIDSRNVKVYTTKANILMRHGRYEEARETLKLATALPSDDGVQYTMWGTLELECGNIEAARSILQQGVRRHPGDHFLLQRWGTLEAKVGNSAKAKELFSKSVLIQPHTPTFVAWAILLEEEALKMQRKLMRDIGSISESKSNAAIATAISDGNLGYAQQQQFSNSIKFLDTSLEQFDSAQLLLSAEVDDGSGSASVVNAIEQRFQDARELFAVGMEVDPQHGPLYHAYGNFELRRGNFSAARRIFASGIAINCSDPADLQDLYHAYGLLEMKANNVGAAVDLFRKGIQLGLHGNREVEAGVVFLLHSLGMLHLECRRFDEALEVFKTGVDLFANHSQMLLGVALSNMRLGKHKEAREFFRLSAGADSSHSHAWQSWAVAEKQLGNYETARGLFREGLRNDPMHGALWQGYGVMEMQLGNFEVARTLFGQAIERSPGHPQSYQAWACLEARLDNLARAKELVWEGIQRSPAHAALWTVAGLVEDKLGNTDTALIILRRGIGMFPRHGALYKVLGELEASGGQYELARTTFAEGLEKDPYYAPTYHAAALLEAKLGDLENLSKLHKKAKQYFQSTGGSGMSSTSSSYYSATGEDDLKETIEKIRHLESLAVASLQAGNNVLSEIPLDQQQHDIKVDSYFPR